MTDTERTEREIVEELKKRGYEQCSVFADYKYPRLFYATFFVGECGVATESMTAPKLLAAIRSLPLPAEQESSTACELAEIAERMSDVLKDGAFSRRRGAEAIQCINRLAAIRASHPEIPWKGKEARDA